MKQYFYIILPMRPDPQYQTKRQILETLASASQIEAHFPFDCGRTGQNSVVADMKTSAFVFADLSYERPSCYYELGLAQALGKVTFLVAQEGTHIHQVLGTVSYYSDIDQYRKLAARAIDEMLQQGHRP